MITLCGFSPFFCVHMCPISYSTLVYIVDVLPAVFVSSSVQSPVLFCPVPESPGFMFLSLLSGFYSPCCCWFFILAFLFDTSLLVGSFLFWFELCSDFLVHLRILFFFLGSESQLSSKLAMCSLPVG